MVSYTLNLPCYDCFYHIPSNNLLGGDYVEVCRLCSRFQFVKLEFLRFYVGSCCDHVKVYDGEDASAPLLGSFDGDSVPADIVSGSNDLFVTFKNDYSLTYDGFNIKYSALGKSCHVSKQIHTYNITTILITNTCISIGINRLQVFIRNSFEGSRTKRF